MQIDDAMSETASSGPVTSRRSGLTGHTGMHAFITAFAAVWLMASLAAAAAPVDLPARSKVRSFATLPGDVRYPEGITADPATGDIYVGTFDARMPESERNNEVLRFDAKGHLVARKKFGPTPLTGLAFAEGKVYILNFGASKLQRLPAKFTAGTQIEDVAAFATLEPAAAPERRIRNPDGSEDVIIFGASGFPAPNGMVFDRSGNLYVSDSFQGAIYYVDRATSCSPCFVATMARDSLLATAGSLPFGANGLALNADESVLYVTNAGDGRLLRLPLPAGPLTVLAESLHGADGLLFHDGLLWVAANQADTVLAVNESGLTVARIGEFGGIGSDGAPRGLLFPASMVVQGNWMIVTNLALPLTPVAGDEWEERVTRWNLVRFRLPRRLDR